MLIGLLATLAVVTAICLCAYRHLYYEHLRLLEAYDRELCANQKLSEFLQKSSFDGRVARLLRRPQRDVGVEHLRETRVWSREEEAMKYHLLLPLILVSCNGSDAPTTSSSGSIASSSASGEYGGFGMGGTGAEGCPPPHDWTCCLDGAEEPPVCDLASHHNHCLEGWHTGVPGHCPDGTGGATVASSSAAGTTMAATTGSGAGGAPGGASAASSSSVSSGGTGGAPGCDAVACNASCAPLCGKCQGDVCACALICL